MRQRNTPPREKKKNATPAKRGKAPDKRPPNTARAAIAARPSREDIEARAYTLFLARGGAHGRDQEDWLIAERELTRTP